SSGNYNTLNISNSKFFSKGQDIVVESIIPYHLYLERNIFSSSELLGSTTPNTRISLIDSPNIAGSTVRLINNTEIRGEQDVHATRFIEHNVDLLAKNNLFTGAIYSDRPSATNEIYYSWFVNPNQQNFPPNAITDYIYYGNPEIDNETFQPLWTETAKSGLIDAGDPDTNGNSIPWWEDIEDQDRDGSRLDIGAVPTIPHGYIQHSFMPLKLSVISYHEGYNWVSFPYMDKMFLGDINGRSADELHYNLHEYNDNELLNPDPDRILDLIEWRYNGNDGPVYYIHPYGFFNADHILDSRHGYKVKMLPGTKRDVIVSGFLAGQPGNPETMMTILPNLHGDHTEIWVGYFKEQSECPFYALQDIEPWLISIKTQRWTISRLTNSQPWLTSIANHLLNFGEAVSLKFVDKVERSFTWKISKYAKTERYVHPMSTYFEYEELIDYIPIYIYLPDEIAVAGIGEIAMSVNGKIVGAEPIMGEIIQINGYIMDMDLENAEVEFLYHEYGSRSEPRTIRNKYLVLNQAENVFQNGTLDLNNGSFFHVVSFKEGDVHVPEIPERTFLEGNFPNPFNPFTTLRYHLSQQENVNLRIYNIRGQLVKTLVNEIQEAGVYSVVWEGDNARGNSVASGVYFYRFETSVGVEVQRMMLLK
ncbi:MAG: T9SS type A sorting domain-containing protein, partial [Candidatus Cloacimonetes bacterium]|nr:T9SS type A sorting domain-containing protein [Candidatus Cloacimonadota bacterium]